MKCLIVDDEPLAIKVMQNHLEQIPGMEIVAGCASAIEAFDLLGREQIDVLFLDIQMPGLTGVDLVRSLENPPSVIFTTAYRDYAVEGFELDAVDYLLKPISLPRLLRAVEKVRRIRENRSRNGADSQEPSQRAGTLNVRADREIVKIEIDDIGYIESLGDYVTIHLPHSVVTTKQRISQLAEKLRDKDFLRIHRSYLVPAKHIISFTPEYVRVGEKELPIGRTYRRQVLAALGFDKVV